MILKNKKNKPTSETLSAGNDIQEKNLFFANRKTVRELIAPTGVNPNPLEYMVLMDNETKIYTLCYYVHKLPRNAKFATTFSPLFNFPHVTSSVFINPMVEGKASKLLDKRVLVLATELHTEEERDMNRARKIDAKLKEAEAWARSIEAGDNILFEVSLLFVLQETDLDKLHLKASEFLMRAREKGIDLAACYSYHPEAFLSSYPTNKIFKPTYGLLKGMSIKKHVMDKGALCTIFNHTRSDFSHKDGIVIGHSLSTGQLVVYNPFDESHDGYGVVIVGKTGSGKSASLKMFNTRFVDFDFKIRSIDFEPRGSVGEYSISCDAVGGINYQIKTNSDNVLNLFEVDKEEVFDETTNTEYSVFRLNSMLSNIKNLEMTMLKNGNEIQDFSLYTFIGKILGDINAELFEQRGIREGDVDSLYISGQSVQNGTISSGKVKKGLPTITDFYKLALIHQFENKNTLYTLPYQLIVDGMRDYVREVYYSVILDQVKFFTTDEFNLLPLNENGIKYYEDNNKQRFLAYSVKGMKPYYDGQSTFVADNSCPHINIDISQLPEPDRNVALLVGLNYLGENCIKKNSMNPKKAAKMIILVDELHKTFKIEEARIFIADVYRTARKRNCSPWTATQMLSDFEGYKETEGILKNATSVFMLKQDRQDRDFLKKATPLTDSQIDRVFSLGGDVSDGDNSRKGELCLIDNSSKVCFLKVDYLTESEARVVETDINKIQAMYKGVMPIN